MSWLARAAAAGLLGCGDNTSAHHDAGHADAGVAFGSSTTITVGQTPEAVALADLDGDGKLDVVVANTNDGTISVLLNTRSAGATTPTFAVATLTSGTGSTSGPAGIAIADFNSDGKPDLAVANVIDGTVTVWLGTTATGAGTPTFAPPLDFNAGAHPEGVVAADFNGDGVADLATANVGDNTVAVLLGATAHASQTPMFAAAQPFAVGAQPAPIVAADLDGNSAPDLIAGDLGANTLSALRNDNIGVGSVPAFEATHDVATGARPIGLAVADIDGDGKLDVIAACSDANGIVVHLDRTPANAFVPQFAAEVAFTTGMGPTAIAVADLDGDHAPDVVTANLGANSISILYNTTAPGATTASFAAAIDIAAGSKPRAIAIGDIDGDGKLDLVVANAGTGTVSIFLAH